MSKSPWGNIGAWAADAERAEAEEREAAEKAAAAQPPASFPSLKESVGAAAKQKKKTKMTLQEFAMHPSSTYSGPASSRGLTTQEMLRLPTGPKERSADDMQPGRLGGGFSSYGARPGSGGRGRDYEGRRSYGYQEDDRRGGSPRAPEMNQPSRADEDDNWGSMKKKIVPEYNTGQARPGGKYSSLGGGPGAASRADDVDNWASSKKAISQPYLQSRSSSFGSGYSRPEPDRWTRNEQTMVSDSANQVEVTVKVNRANPFGAARPREEVLAEKGLDWKKVDFDIEEKKLQRSVEGGSRPTSSQSSRLESPLSSKSELTVGESGGMKQKPKVNPFGNAKPREVLLEEKGLDWKKIDLDLENRRVERPKTEEEKILKEEIERLKREPQPSKQDLILQKEQELETLTRQLDQKVRYSRKIFERQGSGAGRGAGFQDRPYEEPRGGFLDRPRSRGGAYEDPRGNIGERPPGWHGSYDESRPGSRDRPRSRQGAYEESRNEYSERPHSRGTVDSWTRPGEERGVSHHGGGGRGYFGSRDVDRSSSRW